MLTVTPVVLWAVWKDNQDEIPDSEPPLSSTEKITTKHSRNFARLYNAILLLCAAVKILSTKTITLAEALVGQDLLARYCTTLLALDVVLTINHHLAMHFYLMICLLGPVYCFWLFRFERFNGRLEKAKLNGHDGGRAELTMMRNWMLGHLLFDYLLELPEEDASVHERQLLKEIMQSEVGRSCMSTELSMLLDETSDSDGLSLPRHVANTRINLAASILPPNIANATEDLYELMLPYCQSRWPHLQLKRQFSEGPGIAFSASLTTRRLTYIRKDGIRYGSLSNKHTKADSMAYILDAINVRYPAEIVELLLVQLPEISREPHICAVVRTFKAVELRAFYPPWHTL